MPFQAQAGMFPILNFLQANPALAGVQESFKANDYLADAVNKMQQARYAGLQPLATLSANPYMWANPNVQQGLMQAISRFLPGASGQSTGDSSSGGGGFLSSLFGGGGDNSGNTPTTGGVAPNSGGAGTGQGGSSSSGPNLLPNAGQSLGGKIQGNITTPFNEQKYGKGVLAQNPNTGEQFSTPAESTIANQQHTIIGIQNAIPILNDIGKEAPEFLKTDSYGHLAASQMANILEKTPLHLPDILKKNIDMDMAGRKNILDADKLRVVETLKGALNFPNDQDSIAKLQQIIEPQSTDNENTYHLRVMKELSGLTDRYGRAQFNLSGGFPTQGNQLNSAANQPGFNPQVGQQLPPQQGMPSEGAKRLSQNLQLPSFGSKQEFQDWYKKQPKVVRDAVSQNLRKVS